jgi:hypothetical protein
MYKEQSNITRIITKNKKRTWEDEPTFKMISNVNKIYND